MISLKGIKLCSCFKKRMANRLLNHWTCSTGGSRLDTAYETAPFSWFTVSWFTCHPTAQAGRAAASASCHAMVGQPGSCQRGAKTCAELTCCFPQELKESKWDYSRWAWKKLSRLLSGDLDHLRKTCFWDSGMCLQLPRAFGFCGGDPGCPGAWGWEAELPGSGVCLLLILPLKVSREEGSDTFSPPVALHKNSYLLKWLQSGWSLQLIVWKLILCVSINRCHGSLWEARRRQWVKSSHLKWKSNKFYFECYSFTGFACFMPSYS